MEIHRVAASRSGTSVPNGFQTSQTFYSAQIDLQPTSSELFSNLHKDSTQRKIRRAEREGLTYDEGRSEELARQVLSADSSDSSPTSGPVQPR